MRQRRSLLSKVALGDDDFEGPTESIAGVPNVIWPINIQFDSTVDG